MKHIISYSGGLGSFATAYRVVEAQGAENCLLLFTDTKTEDEDLYRFLDESSKALKVNLEIISDGRNIWEVFESVSFMGNSRIDPCSRILKRELARKWMNKNFTPENSILYVGIGWEEEHRIDRIKNNWLPFTVKAPMLDAPYLEKSDVIQILKDIGISPPRLYGLGFPHNNCGGFCIKTGQAQFKMLYEKLPGRYHWHEERQEKLFEKIGNHGFIRMVVDGKTNYLSLKQFREHLDAKKEVDLFEVGGCGCFV